MTRSKMATKRNDTYKRWEKMFNDLTDKNQRQSAAITRLIAENVAMSSALKEIALTHGGDDAGACALDCLEAVNRKRAEQRELEGPEQTAEESK
jgi:hypothetical protein